MLKSWKKEVLRMFVYVSFPIAMFGIFNTPWFYEDAIYHARLAIQAQRDPNNANLLKNSLTKAKQENLKKRIDERESTT